MRIIKRRFLSTTGAHRRLGFEPLEKRQMLSVTVDTLVDEADDSITDGDVSLRDAIANAPAGETIDFSVNGTINLTLGQLVIFKDLTIAGPGPDQLIIDASGNDLTPDNPDGQGSRIFLVNDFDNNNLLDVTINGVKITNGDVSGVGGAIYNLENLTIQDMVITQNTSSDYGGSSADGGGIYSSGNNHELLISTSIISSNTTSGRGGGVYAQSFYSLTIIDSAVDGNGYGYGYGGGIYARSSISNSQVTISTSTISNNTGTQGGGAYISNGSSISIESSQFSRNFSSNDGGGVYLNHDVDTVEIFSSTFDENTSDYHAGGGAIFTGADTKIVNSTISNNSATWGGGIFRGSSNSLNIDHSTIYENTADDSSAGIYFGGSDTVIGGTLSNSIVAGNSIGGTIPSDVTGTILANYNLIEDPTGATIIGPGNILGADPLLGPLTDNGGPTFTHALLPDSSAINAGDPGFAPPPTFDQRGAPFNRVSDGRIDIGAFEVQVAAPPSADFDTDDDIDGKDFLAWQRGYGITSPDGTKQDGDANNDQSVDGLDLGIWQDQFGSTPEVAAAVMEENAVDTTTQSTSGNAISAIVLLALKESSILGTDVFEYQPTETRTAEELDLALSDPLPALLPGEHVDFSQSKVSAQHVESDAAIDEVFSSVAEDGLAMGRLAFGLLG